MAYRINYLKLFDGSMIPIFNIFLTHSSTTCSLANRIFYGRCLMGLSLDRMMSCWLYLTSIVPISSSFLEKTMWYRSIKSLSFFICSLETVLFLILTCELGFHCDVSIAASFVEHTHSCMVIDYICRVWSFGHPGRLLIQVCRFFRFFR